MSATHESLSMRALRLHGENGANDLRIDTVRQPTLGPGDALVRVRTAALTRDELDWKADQLPAIPSYELCGVVNATAGDVDSNLVGSVVFALTAFERDGVASDFAAVPAKLLAPVPAGLDDAKAAALALPGLSAWQMLFDHGGMEKGDRVLVLGAAGGVGQFVTQLARLNGAFVIGTASSRSRELALELGAHEVIDPVDQAALNPLSEVDRIMDTVGGDLVARASTRLRSGGRLVSVAEEPTGLDDKSVTASYFVVEPNAEQLGELGRLAGVGDLRVAVDSVFPLEAAKEAFERVQSTGKRGKVVLRISDA